MLVQHYTGGCRPQSECGSAANVKTNERIDADSFLYAKTVICTFHQQAPDSRALASRDVDVHAFIG